MKRPFGIPLVVPAFVALVMAGAFVPGLGEWGLFPLLGIFPGVALATLLPLESGALARWTLGIAVSPLASCACAWVLMRAGLTLPAAALSTAAAGLALWLWTESVVTTRAPAGDEPREGLRFAWSWSLGASALVALFMFGNPWLRVRGDAWVHAGIVSQILERGIPPQDPRFAGLTLNYVWLYNYFIALLSSLRGGDPFAFMALSNVAVMFATMGVAWLLGRLAWGTARAAAGAALLMGLGLNAGIVLVWPLRFARAFVGRTHGPEVLHDMLAEVHWNDIRVIFELAASPGYMVNFLDKPLHGTAVNLAYLCMLVYLWAMLQALGGRRSPALVWGAATAAGMLFFHGVVGLSVLPAAGAGLALAWLFAGRWTWLPSRSRVSSFAAATVAGALLAAPYTIAIARAWPAAASGMRFSYLHPDVYAWSTLAMSLAVTAWFARGAIHRIVRERRGPGAVLGLFTLGILAFAAVISLPLANHAKFVFEVFAGLVVLAGVAFLDELASWRKRLGPLAFWVFLTLLFGSTPLLTLRGFALDRPGLSEPDRHLVPGEAALYAWIHASTPANAVFVDFGYRSQIMVEGGRQLFLGSRQGPELAAFPLTETLRRRAVMADLYGPADSLEHDATLLTSLERPAYVVVRGGDADSIGAAAVHLDARTGLFARVYDRDGFIVYHVRSTKPSPPPMPGAPRP